MQLTRVRGPALRSQLSVSSLPRCHLGQVVPTPGFPADNRALVVEGNCLWIKIQGQGRVQLRCSRRHSVGGFIQGFCPVGLDGLDLEESRCGASRSPPVNQGDLMCQKLSLRVTIQPEGEIFPECFDSCCSNYL